MPKIRKPELDDLPRIVEVHHKSAVNAYQKILPPEVINKIFGKEALYQDWYKYLRSAEKDDSLLPLVVLDNQGKITGVSRANIGNKTEHEILQSLDNPLNAPAHLKNIYIDPESQTRGAGAALIKASALWAKKKNCKNLMTMVLDGYEQSPKFFKHVANAGCIGSCESDVSAMYKNLPQGSVTLKFKVYNMSSMDYIISRPSSQLMRTQCRAS